MAGDLPAASLRGRSLPFPALPVEEDGRPRSHTVVEFVTDDMPFPVDHVADELSRQDRAIHVAVHPQMPARRDVEAAGVPHDVLVES